MFEAFTWLADWRVFELLTLGAEVKLAAARHFFIEDTTKIFALLWVMIYLISLARISLDLASVRGYLQGKNRLAGYLAGASFGVLSTPAVVFGRKSYPQRLDSSP